MDIFTLTKGVAALSTAGGAVLGGFFASNTLIDKKEEKPLTRVDGGSENGSESGNAGSESEASAPSVNREEREDRGSVGEETSNRAEENSDSEQSSVREAESVSASDSDVGSQESEPQIDGSNIVFESSFLNDALTGTQNYVPPEDTKDENEEEQGETFEPFQDDSHYYYDEEGEELQSPMIAEYLKTRSEKQEERNQGPVCETWFRQTGGGSSKSKSSSEDCNKKVREKVWGRRNVPSLVGIVVEEGWAKKVLESYGLWDSSSQFKNSRNSSWTTGNWMCYRESTSDRQENKRFLISCDYYPQGNNSVTTRN
ncbi:hypothetical protein [Mycoplasma suis]|uniref:Uncharacterized protein n=1 Tax=Mycoplasma suis (strain Illinois) TaxID=768700 RepID=F0QQL5_MYCSL|nr:hypothetical protein [Mycoplasma suis]ADX97785.1 hypothetical protein MSU_0241 [Mycoplasma suis str. Illinois]